MDQTESIDTLRPLELYIHIPFCIRKCSYCDFLSFPAGEDTFRRYSAALKEEIRHFPGPEKYHVVSVFFGGGTPSLPPAEYIADILKSAEDHFQVDSDAEITIEANPGTLSAQKLQAYRRAGFSRLSLGLQSSDDLLLKRLGRIHTWETFRKEYGHALAAGFTSISVDLMYGLPGQTPQMFRKTLTDVLSLPCPPPHLSVYSLIVEPGTSFWDLYHEDNETKMRGEKPLFLPSEDEEAEMLSDLKNILTSRGYHRYEISSWARDGFECRHNKGYWERREYAGFGLGASSMTGHLRTRNVTDMAMYLAHPGTYSEVTELTPQNEMEETMFLGLREMKGVSRRDFALRHQAGMDDVYGAVIPPLVREGLLADDGETVRLTDRGIDVSNLVMAEFLLD